MFRKNKQYYLHIKYQWSLYDGIVRLRKLSCHCYLCISINFWGCAQLKCNKNCVDCDIKLHLANDVMLLRNRPNKRRRVSDDSNHNNGAWINVLISTVL